ncbi:hypothetical protein A1Q2_00956 [Trichosporon asahii var. asahii CBS 8904]|uniref:2-oxoadipate dioxygenase/decarboxylase n=1 Tax=Trichosporon asahii var. asahii (strain CBS 8904) TaxID=1220162 RepID=K1VVY4_TRIAC|nr:hypothetical protein A1Q2_00956 [Trichosporon asahii var. asahii CBS 8904]
MTGSDFVSPDELRARFCAALSAMYRSEVPLYGDLVELVDDLIPDRLKVERHGAIRLGKPDELAMIARLFGLFGMQPVGYYDLSPSGVPVHSTAFRPVNAESLAINPFRVFTSLLLPELLEPELRAEVESVLAERDIFHPRVREIVAKAEAEGGVRPQDAEELVQKALETFKWHDTALVTRETYDKMHAAHPLVADIAAFRGPHINHLTPRVLDIDAAQTGMSARGITPKTIIEGPPKRECEILLRQTSFQALTEPITFPPSSGAGTPASAEMRRSISGSHRARFGEIEQRGCALTRKGHAMYVKLMSTVPAAMDNEAHQQNLAKAFASFPDTYRGMFDDGLAYFEYDLVSAPPKPLPLPELVASGHVALEPVTYEDFLPASAAGIFQSNLDERDRSRSPSPNRGSASKTAFEKILPVKLHDSFELYERIQEKSLRELENALGFAV